MRIAIGLGIVAAGAVAVAIVGVREIGNIREGRAADAQYARLFRSAALEQAAEFNLDNLTIPKESIHFGGPAKDGIPSLIDPEVVPLAEASQLYGDDRVIGVTIGGESRAYPIRILTYHEVVNDIVGGVPIATVYCPLCDSVSVVDRRLDGKTYTFGISGLLYNSNVLLFDRTDDALWSQLGFTSISGPNAGRSLAHFGWAVTTAERWWREHPDSTVLTTNTGYDRDYDRTPYGDYFETDLLIFKVDHEDRRLERKARVVGVVYGDTVRAYPDAEIQQADGGVIRDTIDGRPIELAADAETGSVRVIQAPPEAHIAHSFWFAWAAFHPDTDIYKP